MSSAEHFQNGYAAAREVALQCRREAETEPNPQFRTRLLSEAARHEERADWYAKHARIN